MSFFYRGTYEAFDEHKYLNHAGVFALAVKYGIQGLQDLASAEYWRTCQKEWDMSDFLDSVPGIYRDTHEAVRDLRDHAQRCARVHIRDLLEKDISCSRWQDICLTVPDFTYDILTHLAQTPIIGNCYSCGPNRELESIQCRCKHCGKIAVRHK